MKPELKERMLRRVFGPLQDRIGGSFVHGDWHGTRICVRGGGLVSEHTIAHVRRHVIIREDALAPSRFRVARELRR